MKMIIGNIAANRLESILNTISDDIYMQSLIIARHMVEDNGYDIDFIVNVYEYHIHDIALLIAGAIDSREHLQAIYHIADPLLLFSFNVVIRNSVEFLKKNKALFPNYESDKNFFLKFALFTISKSEEVI